MSKPEDDDDEFAGLPEEEDDFGKFLYLLSLNIQCLSCFYLVTSWQLTDVSDLAQVGCTLLGYIYWQ